MAGRSAVCRGVRMVRARSACFPCFAIALVSADFFKINAEKANLRAMILKTRAYVLVVLFSTLGHQAVHSLISDDLVQIKCKVYDRIEQFQGDGPQALLAKIVRLAFHDCVGGCDGTVDTSIHGNEGLDVPINQLQAIFSQNFASKMSRADFWAAAATFSIYKGVLNAYGPNQGNMTFPPLKFYSGRVDGSGIKIDQPNPHGGIQHVVGFFRTTFNLTVQDTVAIMGAHTLGRASPQNSGFQGAHPPPSSLLAQPRVNGNLRSSSSSTRPPSRNPSTPPLRPLLRYSVD
jgi:hypothetical protein